MQISRYTFFLRNQKPYIPRSWRVNKVLECRLLFLFPFFRPGYKGTPASPVSPAQILIGAIGPPLLDGARRHWNHWQALILHIYTYLFYISLLKYIYWYWIHKWPENLKVHIFLRICISKVRNKVYIVANRDLFRGF